MARGFGTSINRVLFGGGHVSSKVTIGGEKDNFNSPGAGLIFPVYVHEKIVNEIVHKKETFKLLCFNNLLMS